MTPGIRLTQSTLDALKATFLEVFVLPNELWVFGSRVKPEAKGGDIDLLIDVQSESPKSALAKKIQFLVKLKRAIGEQKIDVVLQCGAPNLPIHTVAKQEGVRLI